MCIKADTYTVCNLKNIVIIAIWKDTEHRISSVLSPPFCAEIEEYSQEQIMLVIKTNPCEFTYPCKCIAKLINVA